MSRHYVEALEKQIALLEAALARIRPTLSDEQTTLLDLDEATDMLIMPANGAARPQVMDTPDMSARFRRTPEGYIVYYGRTSMYWPQQRDSLHQLA